MSLLREWAYNVLELPFGTDEDSIRTSYKRLANRCHPEKNPDKDTVEKFRDICEAYRTLVFSDNCSEDEEKSLNLSLAGCLQLYQDVFCYRQGSYNNLESSNEDDSDEDDDEEDDDLPQLYHNASTKNNQSDSQSAAFARLHLSEDETIKNARELISEEEKEKRRTEKRKAKKKRRREKKKQEKQTTQSSKTKQASSNQRPDPSPHLTGSSHTSHNNHNSCNSNSNASSNRYPPGTRKDHDRPGESDSTEELDFDRNSAFFNKVMNKKKKVSTAGEQSEQKQQHHAKDKSSSRDNTNTTSTGKNKQEDSEDMDPDVLKSRQLASRGNEMAKTDHYEAAIELFTEAIKLNSNDYRFFGNRSYCYHRVRHYDKALKDADRAITLAPEWPKGHFRKGQALAGLKMNADSEKAFIHVLRLDKNCEDAVKELLHVRTQYLIEMGFSRQRADLAIKEYGSISQALDSLLSSSGVNDNSVSTEVYVSDDDDFADIHTHMPTAMAPSSSQLLHQMFQPSDKKTDPNNPEGLTALWVGNVLPEVTEKKLIHMFSKYGEVTSVRCLPEKFCAFVNFRQKECAGQAMKHLQGVESAGQKLLIKFPDNPIIDGQLTIRKSNLPKSSASQPRTPAQLTYITQARNSSTVTTATSSAAAAAVAAASAAAEAAALDRISGPVNGDECYFWRTTGCQFGDKCRNRHISQHKGVDKKPWQKQTK